MGASIAIVLLSRQALHPCGTTPWVRQALAALHWIKAQGLTVVTSVGMPTWEFLCGVASLQKIPQIILLPARNQEHFARLETATRRGFSLDHTASCRPVYSSGDKEAMMQLRDETALATADTIIPISLRPDGSLVRRLQSLPPDRTILHQFAIPYETREEPLKYAIDADTINPRLEELPGRYLIHWTRATHGCWPDERPIDYYRDLIASDCSLHTAYHTLLRILTTRHLLASERHMPRDVRAVAFSGLPPKDVTPLMRWRARYREMSFEPYGIGIELETALSLGIRPVIYHNEHKADCHPAEGRWRLQSVGTKTDWSQEEEYRHLGDLDLRTIPDDKLLVFCHTPAEAGRLVTATGLPCMSLTARETAAVSG